MDYDAYSDNECEARYIIDILQSNMYSYNECEATYSKDIYNGNECEAS